MVNDLAGLKPIFFRLEEIAKQNANDFEVQLAVGDIKQHLVNRGTKLKQMPDAPSVATPPPMPPPAASRRDSSSIGDARHQDSPPPQQAPPPMQPSLPVSGQFSKPAAPPLPGPPALPGHAPCLCCVVHDACGASRPSATIASVRSTGTAGYHRAGAPRVSAAAGFFLNPFDADHRADSGDVFATHSASPSAGQSVA